MTAVVVSKVPREGGMVDVTLSQGGTRFTVSVPEAVDANPGAQLIYQRMADAILREADTLRSIVEANRRV